MKQVKLILLAVLIVVVQGCVSDSPSDERAKQETARDVELQKLRAENANLRAEIDRLRDRPNRNQILPIDHVWTDNSTPPKSKPPVDGKVLRYDKATNMLQINVGSEAGVQIGHRFDVVRGSNYICTIMIDYVEKQTSVGHVVIPGVGKSKTPMPGDLATNLSSK